MCTNYLVLREDSSTFKVVNLCEYLQHFVKYIGIDIAISSFFTG
jgi:hypothetical protein